jgi:hypothetical protein
MRTCDPHAQRLGSVEPSAANEWGSPAQRVRARGESHLLWKSEAEQERTRGEPEAEDEAEEDAPDNEVNESGHACRQKGW